MLYLSDYVTSPEQQIQVDTEYLEESKHKKTQQRKKIQ